MASEGHWAHSEAASPIAESAGRFHFPFVRPAPNIRRASLSHSGIPPVVTSAAAFDDHTVDFTSFQTPDFNQSAPQSAPVPNPQNPDLQAPSTQLIDSARTVQGLLTNSAPQSFDTPHSSPNPSQVISHNSRSPSKSPIPITSTWTPEAIQLLRDYENRLHSTARCATDIVDNLYNVDFDFGATLATSDPVSNIEEISSDAYDAQSNGTYTTSVSGQMHGGLSDQGCDLDAFMDGFTNYHDELMDVSTLKGPAPASPLSNLTFDNSTLLHSTASPIRETSDSQSWAGSKRKADAANLEAQEGIRGSLSSASRLRVV
jgi:hypothetical protein